MNKDFLRGRIKAAGERTGVKVTPHQLRHTYATQLVNAGCKITTIQALRGHKHINTTLTYARVLDRTVAEDYFAAMAEVEKRLEPHLPRLSGSEAERSNSAPGENGTSQRQLLRLVEALQAGPLNETQQVVVTELRHSLEAIVRLPMAMPEQPE